MTDKFCINCFYFRKSDTFPYDHGYAHCVADEVTDIDLVTGRKGYRYCSVLRKGEYNACGPEGKLYVDRAEYESEHAQWQEKQDSMDTLEQRINEGLDPF